MDLIEEEDLTPPEADQEREDVMGLSQPPCQDLLHPRSALAGEEPAGRRLPDAGRTGEKHVAQRFAPLLRGAGRQEQVLDRAALADEVIEARGREPAPQLRRRA